MHIGIHGKKFDQKTAPFIQKVFDELDKRKAEIVISEEYQEQLSKNRITARRYATYKEQDDLQYLDFMFTLGGDGTLLEALTHVGPTEVPILGINTGRLGFLATTSKQEIEQAIQCLFSSDYSYDERTLLRLESDEKLFDGLNFALNDFTILKKDTTSMIVVHAYIDGEFLNSYWADGIIVSTPTGSTGYNISCGGPLVLPQSNNFIITPVSPHNLTVRPIVVPDNCELSFTVEGRSGNFLISLDSRFETIDDSVRLKVVKEKFKAKLVKLRDNNYFETLRQKLNWGLDVRN
ncbi:NAD kinase [Fulvivirga imtechensis AK7]|uniref:NAD kinase n=1 Tax=Fulvivirga imtechensis AK7 TaxID=1237149 RepID=L8JR94_9BACT|nr:NAD kinase [Fulvivirga imtechensis]ELR71385.1 NAD kinase [Fulvivirga imtechensis AK7]